jgi:hypothetical protein
VRLIDATAFRVVYAQQKLKIQNKEKKNLRLRNALFGGQQIVLGCLFVRLLNSNTTLIETTEIPLFSVNDELA